MLHLLFFASGLAGLIYEVCWVRLFGNVFGNTVFSASLVTAVFMGGLGAGSLAAGHWADRRARRANGKRAFLRAYAGAELGVAIFGLALAIVLPRLAGFSAQTSTYVRGAAGWFELSFGSQLLRYVVAALLMMPPSFLMGATLTLLVRHVIDREVAQAGFRIGALYGINTAGAALGALLTDSWLVPRLGIFGTQASAVAVNVAVCVGALFLARTAREEAGIGESSSTEATPAMSKTLIAACVALAMSGFAALGMEIVWFRYLSMALGAYRPVFSLLLVVILVGIWLGSTAGGYGARRFGKPLALFIGAQALFAISTLLLLATFTHASGSAYRRALVSIGSAVFLPAVFMGFSFPLVSAIVHDTHGSIGRRTGLLYLSNTGGSIAGSLVAGFVLAPRIGSQSSVGIFAACAAVAPFAIVVAQGARDRLLRLATAVGAGASIVALAAWSAIPSGFLIERFVRGRETGSKVLEQREGVNEIVTIVELPHGLGLDTNGHPMSGTSLVNQRYMRAFAHLPLLMTDQPERALVICFGVGNTLHATSLHPSLKQIELADLSRNVLEHAGWFREANHDVLLDPRVSVFVDDGRQHLRMTPPDTYDLVTLEPPPIAFAGVSALYSREFYEIVKSRLKPTGYMTQWLPAYQVPPEVSLSMARAFVDVFPNSAILSGYGAELILIGTRRSELVLDLDQLESALKANPAVAQDLSRIRLGTLTEIVGTFLADGQALRRITESSTPVTDDAPLMEYTYGQTLEASRALFAIDGLSRFCPKCFVGGRPDPRIASINDYLSALSRLYDSESFRRKAQYVTFEANGISSVVTRFAYLRAIFGIASPEGQSH